MMGWPATLEVAECGLAINNRRKAPFSENLIRVCPLLFRSPITFVDELHDIDIDVVF